MTYEVDTPILNSPFDAPEHYWFIREGDPPQLRDGRRPSIVYTPRDQSKPWDAHNEILFPCKDLPLGHDHRGFDNAYLMVLVNQIRARVNAWRNEGYPGTTYTTLDPLKLLLSHRGIYTSLWQVQMGQRNRS